MVGRGGGGTQPARGGQGISAEKPKHRGIIDSVIHAIGKGIEAAAHAVADISESIVKSAPEWGPYVVAAAAAVAGGAQSVASG